jgi:hypothetical protein
MLEVAMPRLFTWVGPHRNAEVHPIIVFRRQDLAADVFFMQTLHNHDNGGLL